MHAMSVACWREGGVPGHIRCGLSESACADYGGPCLQAEAKAAAEQQARLRAEEEARRAAQLKMAAAPGRGTPAGRGQAAPRVGISTCLLRLESAGSLLHAAVCLQGASPCPCMLLFCVLQLLALLSNPTAAIPVQWLACVFGFRALTCQYITAGPACRRHPGGSLWQRRCAASSAWLRGERCLGLWPARGLL